MNIHGENPLSESETNDLMNYLGHVCELVDKVWERSKDLKPCCFGMNIDGECYSIKVEKTKPFDDVDEYIKVTENK